MLAARGIGLEQAEDFLVPSLRALMPDPFHLRDMRRAAERVAHAVQNRERIVIFGDYDVDGATSSALLVRFFRMLGHDAGVYIPDRIQEGYGPNTEALLKLKAQGAHLVITVDCGTTAHGPLAAASDAGLDVVVVDHHLAAEELPSAVAVVNPNRLDETSECRQLAAVGVSFLLAAAVNGVLRDGGYFTQKSEPNLLWLLDLAALGTVCDVVPLTGLNRAFVTQGLKVLARRTNIGLTALMGIAQLNEVPDSYHLGFILGPRINAGGRVGKADLGSRLLITEDTAEAYMLAQELDLLNRERQAIENTVLEEAMIKAQMLSRDSPVLIVQGDGWHPGVIGIVAGRIKEKYDKPVAVIALEKGIGKASVRSVSGVDMGAAITAARMKGLLLAGGGHAMAAGFTVEEAKIPALQEFIAERVRAPFQAYHARRGLKLDAIVTPGAVTPALASTLDRIAPFGPGNPKPCLALRDARIVHAEILKEAHVRCIVSDGGPNPRPGVRVKAMAFRSADAPLGAALVNARGKDIMLAGEIRLNLWGGNESAEFIIKDAIIS